MRPCRLAFFPAALVFCTSGCAVLTVDVDVYKGPLANSERVRVEQVAAMAMGAKPLLLDLRYRAEKDTCTKKESENNKYVRPRAEKVENCLGELARNIGAKVPAMNSIYGQKVNLILDLYRDRRAPIEDSILRAKIELLSKQAQQVVDSMKRAEKLRVEHVKDAVPLFSERQVSRVNEKWATDYSKKVLDAPAFAEKIRSKAVFTDPMNRFSYTLLEIMYTEDMDAFLGQGPRDAIKPPDNPLQAATRGAVANARTLWKSALDIVAFHSPDPPYSRNAEVLAVERAASIASQITSPEQVRLSFPLECKDSVYKELCDTTSLSLRKSLDFPTTEIPPSQYPAHRRHLALTLLRTDGRKLAIAMLGVQQQLEKEGKFLGLPTFPLPWKLQGPASNDVFPTAAERLQDELQDRTNELVKTLILNLDGGRREEGIESLIEDYLKSNVNGNQSQGKSSSVSQHSEQKHALLDSLVNFAEKIVVVGDNDILLQDLDASGDPALAFDKRSADRFVRVLQAIGNSILIQVDEIRKFDAASDSRNNGDQAQREWQRMLWAAELINKEQISEVIHQIDKSSLPETSRNELQRMGAEANTNLEGMRGKLAELKLAKEKELKQAREEIVRLESARERIDGEELKTLARVDLAKYNRVEAIDGLVKLLVSMQVEAIGAGRSEDAKLLGEISSIVSPLSSDQALIDKERTLIALCQDVVELFGKRIATETEKSAAAYGLVTDLQRWTAALVEASSSPKLRLPKNVVPQQLTDSYDLLLGLLQDMRVIEIANNGDSAYARQLEKAWDLAYANRSRLVYLRPASAYLRNSYPASVLQTDPSTVRKNLLMENFKQSLPFTGPDEGSVISQRNIDKQFWQSVNRIRVSGGGKTNYAVVKDDVGNWYVKGYANDPEKIFQSMTKLALFAAGPATRASLAPAEVGSKGAIAKTDGTSNLPEGNNVQDSKNAPDRLPTTLEKQVDRFAKAYETQSRSTHQTLKKEAKKFRQTLKGAAESKIADDDQKKRVSDVFSQPLKTEADSSTLALLKDDETEDKKKPVEKIGEETLSLLDKLHETYRDAVASLRTPLDMKPPAISQETFDLALSSMAAAEKRLRDRVVAERSDTIARFESALEVLGGSTQP